MMQRLVFQLKSCVVERSARISVKSECLDNSAKLTLRRFLNLETNMFRQSVDGNHGFEFMVCVRFDDEFASAAM